MASKPTIRVAVHGASGRVGQEVLRAIDAAPDLELTASIDAHEPSWSPASLPHYISVVEALSGRPADVIVDFSNASASLDMAPVALAAGVRPVIGSTGFTPEQTSYLAAIIDEHHLSGVLAPNFSIGAVLLLRLAAIAARYFDYADVAEEHHETKIDAPSGTAIALAHAIHEGHPERFHRNVPDREPLGGTRGGEYEGITLHSARLPGRMAHHQVTFGAPGQTLTLRHDTINRECYMPGVLLAVRKVMTLDGLTVGLNSLLDL
jgi:4-hydroxy-tetrahydrodipicolinate reductase